MRLRLSIETLLNAISLTLCVALVAVLLFGIRAAWDDFDAARQLSMIAETNRAVFETMQAMRLQRGDVQTTLLTVEDAAAPAEKIRNDAKASLDATLARAAKLPQSDIAGLVDTVRKRAAESDGIWSEILAMTKQPKAERSLKGTLPWYATVTAIIDPLSELSRITGGQARIADPVAGELVTIQQLAWRLRVVAGDECSLARQTIDNGGRLPPEMRGKIDGMRGSSAQLISILGDITVRPGMNPALVTSAQGADQALKASQTAREAVYKRLDDSGKPAIPPAEWTTLCNAPFKPIQQVAEMAIALMLRHAEATLAASERQLAIQAAALLGALAVSGGSLWLVRRRVMRPIRQLIEAIGHLARRDFTLVVPQSANHDEFAIMARTLEALRLDVLEAERQAADRTAAQQADLARAAAVDASCHRFDAIMGQTLKTVSSALDNMTGSADAMTSSTRSARAETGEIATAVQETVNNIAAVAAAIGEMKASIAEITTRVSASARLAGQAVSDAKSTTDEVGRLSEAAIQIGAMVNVISSIAAKTNLLALNATIEAARAGDAGRGFAVVAGEVKTLANQTAEATREITAQVAAIQAATRGAVTAIDGIGGRITEIDEIATMIAAAVEQQDAAVGQLARDADTVSSVSGEVAARLGVLRAATEMTGDAAEAVRETAGELVTQSTTLNREITGFIAEVADQRTAA
ncbi:MAG TPA: methyl-accepting chemotaxis protein [Stellaceae bacterium]|nr:methyl-accepting chemotaxis protein [Stellaceae bacterium]